MKISSINLDIAINELFSHPLYPSVSQQASGNVNAMEINKAE
jgi:hypothetical protein